jgi:Acyl-ACP thioesterase
MKYEEKYIVSSHDVDVNNNIKPSLLIRYMQETANNQMRDRKPSYYDMFFAGQSFILTKMNVEIYQQIHQYEHIVAKTWRCPSKAATFVRGYSIERDGELMALSYSEWAVADIETGRLYRTNEIDISNYETDEIPELKLPKRFRFPKDADFREVGTHHVFYSEVDMNRHMNNTNYSDMLWNYIPGVTEKEVTTISLRFMKEAPLDADLRIEMAKLPEPDPSDSKAEETYMFKSLVPGGTNVEAMFGMRKTKVLIFGQELQDK